MGRGRRAIVQHMRTRYCAHPAIEWMVGCADCRPQIHIGRPRSKRATRVAVTGPCGHEYPVSSQSSSRK